jgi:hypothetical protein
MEFTQTLPLLTINPNLYKFEIIYKKQLKVPCLIKLGLGKKEKLKTN